MEILRLLEQYHSIYSYQILEYKTWSVGAYLKLKILFRDNSVLFVKEFVNETERNYSYHWQNKRGQLIQRWDNAPHHKKVKTFPHHIHRNNKISESTEISLRDVLKTIDF